VTSMPTTMVLSSSTRPRRAASRSWLLPPSLRLNLRATLAKYWSLHLAHLWPTHQTVWNVAAMLDAAVEWGDGVRQDDQEELKTLGCAI
jgi:hypothetical protein